jgi:hypothetical protein
MYERYNYTVYELIDDYPLYVDGWALENLREDEGEIYESMEERLAGYPDEDAIFGMRMDIKYIIKEKKSHKGFFLVKF